LRFGYLATALAWLILTDSTAALGEGAARTDVVRYIEEFSGPAPAWHIARGTQTLAPADGLALAAGDCITLKAATASDAGKDSMLVIDEGVEISLSASRPHYCLSASKPANPVFVAIAHAFASLIGVFKDAETDYATQSTVSVESRRPEKSFKIPILAHDDQLLAAGPRTLALSCSGGTAPYSVTIERMEAHEPVTRTTSATPTFKLAPLDYTPGSYSVTVTDAKNVSTKATFTVVPASRFPASSPDIVTILKDDSLPADLRAAYDAAHLMGDPSNAWRLEAYQRLAGHSRSGLAERLRFQLETYG
jgi:hypothetical protein